MILDMIKKPKWQHRNPSVRETAVTHDLDDPEILADLAQNDEAAPVRCAALRKIMDLALLMRVAQQDSDDSVKHLAQQRFKKLLCEGDKLTDSLSLDTRLWWIQNQALEADLLEYLAKQAETQQLRLAALELVNRESLLGDVASQDHSGEVRLIAVERLTQKSTLERVYKATRNRDKRVSRIAKDKLDAIIELEQRPAKLRTEVGNLCVKLESLGRSGAWEQENAEFNRLQSRWQPLAAEVTILDAELAERFTTAADKFNTAYQQYLQAQQAILRQEQALAPLRAIKQTLCEQIELFETQLHEHERLTDAESDEFKQRLETFEKQWADHAKLDNPSEESQWYERYQQSHQQVQRRLKLLRAWHNLEKQQAALCDEAEHLLEKDKPLRNNAVKDLQHRWQKIPQPSQLPDFVQALNQRFAQDIELLQERLDNAKNVSKQLEKDLKQQLQALETCLAEGELHRAVELEQQARDNHNKLNQLSPHSHRALESRLQHCHSEVRKLRSWQRWGDDIEREQLCEAMEILAERPDDNPEETARLIREAQTAWKKLGTRGHSQELWERFNTACNVAYQPCREYFETQAQQRVDNLAAKEQLCVDVETYVAEIDWQQPDWKALYRYVYDVEKQWHHVGPTNRKNKKPLNSRFENALQPLQQRLQEERTHNLKFRQHLIEKAQQAVEIEDLHAAIDTAKQLQSDWVITVPSGRKEERELWKVFRQACDAVFDRRKQQQEARDKVRQDNLTAKNALCEQIEALANLDAEAIKTAPGQLKKLQADWRHVGELPRKVLDKVEKRYKAACQAVEQAYQQAVTAEQRGELDKFRAKALACTALENIDYATVDSVEDHVAAAQAAWADLAPLPDAELEAQFAQRFAKACEAVAAIQVVEDNPEVRQQRDILCIRLEILAEVDSPPAAMQARMEYQVARLSAAMQGSGAQEQDKVSEVQAIEQEWYLAGAVSAEQSELNARFERALAAFFSKQ